MLVTINCLVPPVILQNSEQSVAARAAPVEGVDSPQPVTQGACDNSFCFLQTTLQLCVLWIIQHQRSLLQILHVNLDGTVHPYCLCRPPVRYCAHTHTHTLSSFLRMFVRHAFGSVCFPSVAVGSACSPPGAVRPTLHRWLLFSFFHPFELHCKVMGGQGRCEWTPDNLPLFRSPMLAGTPVAVGSACTPSEAVDSAYTPSVAVGWVCTLPVTVGCACRSPLCDDSAWAFVGQDCSCRAPLGEDSSCQVPADEGCACKAPVSSNSS